MNKLKYMDKIFNIKCWLSVIFLLTLSIGGFGQVSTKRTNVIIFVDKSLSVNYQRNNSAINSVVQNGINAINNSGDTFTMLYIHSNTIGATPAIAYTVNPLPVQMDNESMLTYKKRRQFWGTILIKDKRLRIQETESYILSNGVSKTNQATDVWAIFEKLSKICTPSSINNVIIFSDMIESMKGTDRRLKLDPKSKKQAMDWAKADYKIINSTFSVNKHNIKNAIIKVVLPYDALGSTFNANVRYYWEELFGLYGMQVEFL